MRKKHLYWNKVLFIFRINLIRSKQRLPRSKILLHESQVTHATFELTRAGSAELKEKMKGSKVLKPIKRKNPVAKKKLVKKSPEIKEVNPEISKTQFWSENIKFKDVDKSEIEKPQMMSVEVINKSIYFLVMISLYSSFRIG